MDRKLRIAQYGCGKMSVYTMRYAMEKGAEIACAFGRSPHNIGKDVGEIAGVGRTGVLVQDSKQAVAVLKEKKPDACIITTASLMRDVERPFIECAESGVNAITLCEEAFYPWNSAVRSTRMLDELARKSGITLCGSGYPENPVTMSRTTALRWRRLTAQACPSKPSKGRLPPLTMSPAWNGRP